MLKVAVVGTGNISAQHMPGWEVSPHAEVVVGVDSDEAVLAAWGKEHSVGRLTTDFGDVLADPTIDIVDICTPNMHHTPLAIAALDAGKHVICEKPLAPTPREIEQLIAARDSSGRELMTAQHYRFSGTARAMKAEIDAGALGDVYHARAWMLRRNTFINSPTFVERRLAGGGACIDIGVHVLDLALWLMGNPRPTTVSGVARTELARIPGMWSRIGPDTPVGDNWDVEEFANAFVRFENGATLMLEVAWALHHDTVEDDIQVWLHGKDGGAHYPSAEFLSTNYDTRQHYKRKLQNTEQKLAPHAYECVEFARILHEGKPSPVPAEQSLNVMRILDGIYASQETGREVMLST